VKKEQREGDGVRHLYNGGECGKTQRESMNKIEAALVFEKSKS